MASTAFLEASVIVAPTLTLLKVAPVVIPQVNATDSLKLYTAALVAPYSITRAVLAGLDRMLELLMTLLPLRGRCGGTAWIRLVMPKT